MSLTRAKSNTQTGETRVTALDVAYICYLLCTDRVTHVTFTPSLHDFDMQCVSRVLQFVADMEWNDPSTSRATDLRGHLASRSCLRYIISLACQLKHFLVTSLHKIDRLVYVVVRLSSVVCL